MVATQVPDTATAGDSLVWERDLSDYPAGTWTLTYYFSNAAGGFNIVASASGTKHLISVLPATTDGYDAGRYRWFAQVTDGTDVFTVENGWIEVKANPATESVDWRSHARKMLDAIEATLEGNATKGQLDLVSYSIGGELNLTRDREMLLKLRRQYTLELADEEGLGQINKRHVYIRFSRR